MKTGSSWGILALLIVLSGLVMNVNLAVNVSAMEGHLRLIIHGVLATAGLLAILLGGAELFPPAWRAVRKRRVVTEHLFLAGIFAAWGVSVQATLTGYGPVFYEVPVLLPAIHRFGTILLMRQRAGIEDATREMLAGISVARVQDGDGWQIVPLDSVIAGQHLLVKAGETIPVDAILVSGCAYVQTRTLTGEPFPVVPPLGSPVSAGTVALDGDLELRAVGTAAGSEVSQLASATQALLERPPVFLGSVATVLAWFFPAVLGASAVTCCYWGWKAGWQEAIEHSLAVVLVACPCAFGVALPLLFRRGLTACLRHGLEPAAGNFMESLAMVKTVAFDKTGTLTTLDMKVTRLDCAPDVQEPMLRAILAALHSRSTHPVARPFWGWAAAGQGVTVRDLQCLPGLGVAAEVSWRGTWLSVRLGGEAILSASLPAWVAKGAKQRRLFLEIDQKLVGVCSLTEELRDSTAAACAALKEMDYRVTILTGDSTIPEELRPLFDEVHTAQRPADKAEKVGDWERSGQPVLFIGDGLNDAQALATATASIAVGDDAGLATSAQARWRRPDFAALPILCQEAGALAVRGRLILHVAIAYNTLGMIIAACGWLHPVAATVIMLISSATVTTLAAGSEKDRERNYEPSARPLPNVIRPAARTPNVAQVIHTAAGLTP